jgi:hypothetical protein
MVEIDFKISNSLCSMFSHFEMKIGYEMLPKQLNLTSLGHGISVLGITLKIKIKQKLVEFNKIYNTSTYFESLQIR